MRNGCALHLHAVRRTLGNNPIALGLGADKPIARSNPPLPERPLQDAGRGTRLPRQRQKPRISTEEPLLREVLEHHGVLIVEARLTREHHVKRAQTLADRSGDPNIHEAIAFCDKEHPRGTRCGIHLANPATRHHHLLPAKFAEEELRPKSLFYPRHAHPLTQECHLAIQCAQYAPSHLYLLPFKRGVHDTKKPALRSSGARAFCV